MKSIEILAVVESVSNEKGIDEGIIFGALETAIATASLRHFHEDAEITVSIDRLRRLSFGWKWQKPPTLFMSARL